MLCVVAPHGTCARGEVECRNKHDACSAKHAKAIDLYMRADLTHATTPEAFRCNRCGVETDNYCEGCEGRQRHGGAGLRGRPLCRLCEARVRLCRTCEHDKVQLFKAGDLVALPGEASDIVDNWLPKWEPGGSQVPGTIVGVHDDNSYDIRIEAGPHASSLETVTFRVQQRRCYARTVGEASFEAIAVDGMECDGCGRPQLDGKAFKRCQCGGPRYCSKACQRAHWKTHKQTCATQDTSSRDTRNARHPQRHGE